MKQQNNNKNGEKMNESKMNMTQKAYDTFSNIGLGKQEARASAIREAAAILWDRINDISIAPEHAGGRYVALSKTALEESIMWAMKGISRSGL